MMLVVLLFLLGLHSCWSCMPSGYKNKVSMTGFASSDIVTSFGSGDDRRENVHLRVHGSDQLDIVRRIPDDSHRSESRQVEQNSDTSM